VTVPLIEEPSGSWTLTAVAFGGTVTSVALSQSGVNPLALYKPDAYVPFGSNKSTRYKSGTRPVIEYEPFAAVLVSGEHVKPALEHA
jgi:hypothetical protein